MCDEENVRAKYAKITDLLLEKGKWITTMESCTSGMIASLLTDREGSSGCIKGAFVTYSNEAKVKIGVPQETIERYGVYSSETAIKVTKDEESGEDMVTTGKVESNSGTAVEVYGGSKITVTNSKWNVSLPSTGGPGTTICHALGAVMSLLAVALLFVRKRSGADGIR